MEPPLTRHRLPAGPAPASSAASTAPSCTRQGRRGGPDSQLLEEVTEAGRGRVPSQLQPPAVLGPRDCPAPQLPPAEGNSPLLWSFQCFSLHFLSYFHYFLQCFIVIC